MAKPGPTISLPLMGALGSDRADLGSAILQEPNSNTDSPNKGPHVGQSC
jgi:hypothetical protein